MDMDEWVLYLVRMSYCGDPYFYTADVSGVCLIGLMWHGSL